MIISSPEAAAYGTALAILMRPSHKHAARLHRRATARGIKAVWASGLGVAIVNTTRRTVIYLDDGRWTSAPIGANR